MLLIGSSYPPGKRGSICVSDKQPAVSRCAVNLRLCSLSPESHQSHTRLWNVPGATRHDLHVFFLFFCNDVKSVELKIHVLLPALDFKPRWLQQLRTEGSWSAERKGGKPTKVHRWAPKTINSHSFFFYYCYYFYYCFILLVSEQLKARKWQNFTWSVEQTRHAAGVSNILFTVLCTAGDWQHLRSHTHTHTHTHTKETQKKHFPLLLYSGNVIIKGFFRKRCFQWST